MTAQRYSAYLIAWRSPIFVLANTLKGDFVDVALLKGALLVVHRLWIQSEEDRRTPMSCAETAEARRAKEASVNFILAVVLVSLVSRVGRFFSTRTTARPHFYRKPLIVLDSSLEPPISSSWSLKKACSSILSRESQILGRTWRYAMALKPRINPSKVFLTHTQFCYQQPPLCKDSSRDS